MLVNDNLRIQLFAAFFCLISAADGRSDTRTVAQGIDDYFAGLETEIVECAGRPEMLARKTSLAQQHIRKLIKNRPEIVSVLQINARGLVLNEEVRDGNPGRKFRDLSNQKWFRQVGRMEPYYGSIVTTTGERFLFWVIPVPTTSRSGSPLSPAGALVVRIDAREGLRNAAKQVKEPFLVLQDKARMFSNEWKSSYNAGPTYPLNLKGMENVVVVVEAEKAAPPRTVQQPSAALPAPTAEAPAGKSNLLLIIIVALLIVGIAAAGIAGWLQISSRKRHAALMAKIDKEQSPFEYGETVVMDRNKLMQAAGREAPAGAGGAASGGAPMPRDGFRETRIMSLEQMRAEVESDINQKLNTVLAERTKQIRREAYGEARLAFLQNMKSYSMAIGRQIDNLGQFIAAGGARGPREAQILQTILVELQRVQDAIEGRPAGQ